MEIKKEVYLREIGGEYVLIPVGKTVDEFNGIFSLTPSGAVIFKAISDGADEDGILAAVLSEFDVQESEARADIKEFLARLQSYGIL